MLNILNSDDIKEFIKTKNRVSVKMLCKKFNLKPKQAHKILKFDANTILDKPSNYGSCKDKNYNLYSF